MGLFRMRLLLLLCVILILQLATCSLVNTIPRYKATLFPTTETARWKTDCFRETVSWLDNGVLYLKTADSVTPFCSTLYLFADRISFYAQEIIGDGLHSVDIKWSEGELEDVQKNGLQIFTIPDNILGEVADLFQFYEFVTQGSTQDLINFMTKYTDFNFTMRGSPNSFIPNKSDIKSGDYFAITDNDLAVSAIIMYGTGGHTDHTAVALWREGELYVCESTMPSVICTPYDQWFTFYENDPRSVSWLRLAPERLALFNETAANEWVDSVLGLPYGLHNFIFGWIDTLSDNYPFPLTIDHLSVGFPLVERIYPEIAVLWKDGLNLRMGTFNLSSEEIIEMLDQRNMTLAELMTVPEQDSWVYPSVPPPGRSMVCDVFVLSMYKAAAIFGNLTDTFQAAEFTPKDSYQLKIFDSEWEMPPQCEKNLKGYCQMTGVYYQYLDGFNSIEVYPHMNEKCGALPKDYVRGPSMC